MGSSVRKNYAQKRPMDSETAVVATIMNQTQPPKLIHEERDSRASRSYHLSQSFVADSRNCTLGFSRLTKVGKQEKNPGKSLLAGIKKEVHQIRLVSNVLGQQMLQEQLRESRFAPKEIDHDFVVNSHYGAIGHGSRGA